MSQDKVQIGKIGKPHGIMGWSSLISFTNPPEQIFEYPWWVETDCWHQIDVATKDRKRQGKSLLFRYPNCTDRNQAQLLTHRILWTQRADFAKLDDGDYYWHDLIGCACYDQHHIHQGEVIDLMATGSNDVLVILHPNGKQNLVPYIDPVVQSVDIEAQRIILHWDFPSMGEQS